MTVCKSIFQRRCFLSWEHCTFLLVFLHGTRMAYNKEVLKRYIEIFNRNTVTNTTQIKLQLSRKNTGFQYITYAVKIHDAGNIYIRWLRTINRPRGIITIAFFRVIDDTFFITNICFRSSPLKMLFRIVVVGEITIE